VQGLDLALGALDGPAAGVGAGGGRLTRGLRAHDCGDVLGQRLATEGHEEERDDGDEEHRPVDDTLREVAQHDPEARARGGSGQLLGGRRMKAARALLAGGHGALALVASIAFAQRLLLPLAVLRLDEREPAVAVAALLIAAALAFVRARAADRLARAVRLNLLELYLGPFERGPAPALPPAEVVTARLATALPLLVSWAVDGIAVVLAATAAVPAVVALLAHALGWGVLAPVGVAGVVGALVTMAAAPRVEAAWTAAWDRSRALFTAVSAGYEGAIDLRAHGRAGAHAEHLRGEVRAWSAAEGRARIYSTFSTWGAFGATLSAGAVAVVLEGGALVPLGDLYRTSLLVLAAVPTLQALIGGVGNLLSAHDELAAAGRQLALAEAAPLAESDDPIDATAEIRLEGVAYAYPARSPGAAPVVALEGVDLVLPPRGSVAVTGPNGAGKTTLVHVLLGVVRPDRGRILVGGREARLDNRRYRARVAYLSQRPFEIATGTLADNLRAFDAGHADERLLQALSAVGLREPLRARAESDAGVLALPYAALSRGQARRVMLARALLRDADLLVLDEPEAHLDAASVIELEAILRQVARERRVVAVVHDRELTRFADRVVELTAPAAERPA
jgi:ABC-type multidrug transport system fused ATPase/permease subunit